MVDYTVPEQISRMQSLLQLVTCKLYFFLPTSYVIMATYPTNLSNRTT